MGAVRRHLRITMTMDIDRSAVCSRGLKRTKSERRFFLHSPDSSVAALGTVAGVQAWLGLQRGVRRR